MNNIINYSNGILLDKAKDKLPIPSSFEDGIRLREYFVEIQGMLNYSDWLASGQGETPPLNFKENFLSDHIITRQRQKYNW